MVHVKNPDYLPRKEPPSGASGGKLVKVDRVEWLYIPEAVTAAQALGAGEIDYSENVPSDYAPALARCGDYDPVECRQPRHAAVQPPKPTFQRY